jgi:penicillin amidase
LADFDNSLYVITTGQSGNIFSKYYDDFLPLWAEGRYVKIPTDRGMIDAQAQAVLTLTR